MELRHCGIRAGPSIDCVTPAGSRIGSKLRRLDLLTITLLWSIDVQIDCITFNGSFIADKVRLLSALTMTLLWGTYLQWHDFKKQYRLGASRSYCQGIKLRLRPREAMTLRLETIMQRIDVKQLS